MSWLTLQMWLLLLVAGGFGGLIGWAIQSMRATAAAGVSTAVPEVIGDDAELRLRMVELETQLRQEKEENAMLRARVSTGPSQQVADKGEAAVDEEGTLAFRNRHLESRVRFLEGKIADLESEAAQPKADDEHDEATRLRWRNRYLEGRVKYLEEELVRKMPALATAEMTGSAMQPVSSVEKLQPPVLTAPRNGRADDLKAIGGIGPKLERKLNDIGIWHYDQIASWTPAEIEWINSAISFRGRIERENWVTQAAQLAQGGARPSV